MNNLCEIYAELVNFDNFGCVYYVSTIIPNESSKWKLKIILNQYCSTLNPGTVEYTTYNLKNSHTNVNYNDPFIDHSGIKTNVILNNGAFVSGDSLSSDEMTSGQTSVSYNNGIYTITFSFSNAQNIISGTYTGTLSNLNYQY